MLCCIRGGFIVLSVFLVFGAACRNEWALLDQPLDQDDRENIEYHLRECALLFRREGEQRHRRERCAAEIAQATARYLDLGGSCRIARGTREYADLADPGWGPSGVAIDARCGSRR